MNKKERYQKVLEWFAEHNPDAETELHYETPYQLLIAVILSAQCTDKRVNMVTPALFKDFNTPEKLAAATPEEVHPYIKSINFANNKAKHLVGMARLLVEKYHSEVPQTVEELMELPGVGRKTANVVTSVVFSQARMAVDTHVFRVSARIGLTTNAKTPLQAELQLIKYIPEELVHIAHHWLILHGRYICVARRPKCEQCGITAWCKYFEKLQKEKQHLN